MSASAAPLLVDAATPNAWGLYGHDAAVEAFRRALRGGHLSHAYLLAGPSGVGKQALARRLAQVLVAPRSDDPTLPDPDARVGRQIEDGVAPDVERIAIGGVCDESSHDHTTDRSTRIRICQVRRLERVAALAPFAAPRRIFIIDSADELQTEAAHALLKTLEEPPGGATLILLATDVDALLPTIRSRCQEFVLRPLAHAALAGALHATLGLDEGAATALARLAHGRYGLAMRLHADPAIATLRRAVADDARRLLHGTRNDRLDYAERLGGSWYREREAVLATVDLWREWWHEVLLAAVDVPVEVHPEAREEAARCGAAGAARALRSLQTARDHLLANTNPELALGVMLLDLPALPPLPPLAEPRGEETVASDA